MKAELSVRTGELRTGAGQLAGLTSRTVSTGTAVEETLSALVTGAGHADVASALAGVGGATARTLVGLGTVVDHIATSLTRTAADLEGTDNEVGSSIAQVAVDPIGDILRGTAR